MKKIVTLILVLLSQVSFAQINLVPNPSFEDTISCPQFQGQVSNAIGWSSYGYSPDYFNACANTTSNPIVGVPSNEFGFQAAFHGNAYAGLGTTDAGFPFREFIGAQLIQPLDSGIKYYVSAFISRADSFPCFCSANNFGFRFSNTVFTGLNAPPIDNFSHVHSDSIITDNINWTRVGGSFIADSSYQYLIIGNFYDDAHTNTLNCLANNISYYFVDAVCVSTDSLYCLNWTGQNELEPISNQILIYPNPVSRFIYVKNLNDRIYYTLHDISNRIIKKDVLYKNKNQIDVSAITSGIYILNIEEKYFYKIIIYH